MLIRLFYHEFAKNYYINTPEMIKENFYSSLEQIVMYRLRSIFHASYENVKYVVSERVKRFVVVETYARETTCSYYYKSLWSSYEVYSVLLSIM